MFGVARFVRLFCAGTLLFCSGGLSDRDESSLAAGDAPRPITLRGAVDSVSSSLVQTRSKTRRTMTREPEQLGPWENSHQAVVADPATISPAALMQMSQGINAQAFKEELHGLCDSFQTRFVGTDGNVDMSTKVKAGFEKLGLQTWTEDLDVVPGVEKYLQRNSSGKMGGNIIAFMKGTDLAREVVVVGAHYDSVNWEEKGGIAPGVDDNGSGSALVQLVARALANSGVKPRRSLMFVGFNAEEEGLIGSTQMAAKAKLGHYGDIKAALIADEVAYPGSGAGSRRAILETVGTVPGTDSLVDTFANQVQLQKSDGVKGIEVNLEGFGSDHMPFLKHNIPSLLLIERNNIAHADQWGHSRRDSYDHVDFEYGASMARLMLRAATALSSPAGGAPGGMRNVSLHAM